MLVSFGVSVYLFDEKISVEDLLVCSDEVMYCFKYDGKGCVSFWVFL